MECCRFELLRVGVGGFQCQSFLAVILVPLPLPSFIAADDDWATGDAPFLVRSPATTTMLVCPSPLFLSFCAQRGAPPNLNASYFYPDLTQSQYPCPILAHFLFLCRSSRKHGFTSKTLLFIYSSARKILESSDSQ